MSAKKCRRVGGRKFHASLQHAASLMLAAALCLGAPASGQAQSAGDMPPLPDDSPPFKPKPKPKPKPPAPRAKAPVAHAKPDTKTPDTKTPVAAPQTVAPGGNTQQTVPPAQPPQAPAQAAAGQEAAAGAPHHRLEGVWKLYWLNDNLATDMRVGQVFPGTGVTNFVGALATLKGEVCPLTATVFDKMSSHYQDGIEQKDLTTLSFVVIRAQCTSGLMWIEALGMPAGKILMSGRATFVPTQGPNLYYPVGLGR